jgi:hypothetical protein
VADEKKNLQTLVDHLVLQAMAGRVIKTQNQASKPRLQRVEGRCGDRSTKGNL